MTALAMGIIRFVAAMEMNGLPRNPCWRKPRLGAPCTYSLRPPRHAFHNCTGSDSHRFKGGEPWMFAQRSRIKRARP
jgi:hypothetical protein